jgi:excisionase family DNA binding protein
MALENVSNRRQLTLQEASEIYGIPLWTLYKYVEKRMIPYRKVRRRIYIPVEKFEKWLESLDVEPEGGER